MELIMLSFTNVSDFNNLQPAQTSFSIEQCENALKISGKSMLGVFLIYFQLKY